MAKNNETPEFSLDGNRFDQSTYFGRFRGFLDVIDPRCLFVSDGDLQKSVKLLDTFKAHQQQLPNTLKTSSSETRLPAGVTDEKLWEAKKLKDAVLHPVTGEKIQPLFRMAAFLPVNVPLVAGMLNANSVAGTLFWQWANQSYNSAINYSNRSGSDIDMTDLAQSYGVAVGVSCSLAMGFRYLGQNGPKFVRTIAKIPFVVPFIAVASAGSANVYFSRQKEIENGVAVFDENNVERGVSKTAAKQGVFKTILSRSIGLPIPVLILPHFLMKIVPKSVSPRRRMFYELGAITLSLVIGLPGAIAIFPQRLQFSADSLEPEFHNLKDEKGNKINTLYCNKGL